MQSGVILMFHIIKSKIKYNLARFWSGGQSGVKNLGFQSSNCRLPILVYHSVNPSYTVLSITPDNFEKQINYLTSNYNVISLPMLVDQLYKNCVPLDAAVVTFDDGYEDNYIYAYPILRKYKCPATIFLSTGFIIGDISLPDEERLNSLNWLQIMEMKNEGFSFGSHAHYERHLTEISLREVHSEIKRSKSILEEKLGEDINFFAYPFGKFNKEIIELLKQHNFIAACSTIWSTSNSPEKLFFLNRVRIDPEDNLKVFKLKVAGAYDYIRFIHHKQVSKNIVNFL